MDVRRTGAPDPLSGDVGDIIDAARAAGSPAIDEHSAKALLARLGIAVPRSVRVSPDADAAAACRALTPPFAAKALCEEAIHKSDIGAVRLALADAMQVQAACREIAAAMQRAGKPLLGFLVEEMAPPGIEIVIGGTIDPQLGPMVMLGAGGIYAEIMQDASFRLCPIDERDADEMIGELRMAPMLNGARGKPAVDIAALRAMLLALAGAEGFFTRHCDAVAEFDLNPIVARSDGAVALDCRIVLAENTA